MNLSSEGAAFLRHGEGFVDHWYLDPIGVPTIGIGFTWRSEGFREWWTRNRPGQKFAKGAIMTRAEADTALRFVSDMEYGKALNKFLGQSIKQHAFDAALSAVYNMGTGSLKWKWAAALKSGNLNEAAARLQNTGTTADGKKLNGLIKRRIEEAQLLEHGDYTYGNYVHDAMSDGVLMRGERGADVADLQGALAKLGLYAGAVDGIFGFGTEAAVLEYQRGRKLSADGRAGAATLAAIERDLTTAPAEPKPQPTASAAPGKGRGFTGWAILVGIILATAIYIIFIKR